MGEREHKKFKKQYRQLHPVWEKPNFIKTFRKYARKVDSSSDGSVIVNNINLIQDLIEKPDSVGYSI
jgi:hypothetical protein